MSKSKIDFHSFTMQRGQVLIEYITETDSGLILVNDTKTSSIGWYKVVKSGKFDNAQKAEEDIVQDWDKGKGKEVLIFFHNSPITIPEVLLKSTKEQEEAMKKEEAMSNIILSDGMGGLKQKNSFENERIFAMVPAHSILFTRDIK